MGTGSTLHFPPYWWCVCMCGSHKMHNIPAYEKPWEKLSTVGHRHTLATYFFPNSIAAFHHVLFIRIYIHVCGNPCTYKHTHLGRERVRARETHNILCTCWIFAVPLDGYVCIPFPCMSLFAFHYNGITCMHVCMWVRVCIKCSLFIHIHTRTCTLSHKQQEKKEEKGDSKRKRRSGVVCIRARERMNKGILQHIEYKLVGWLDGWLTGWLDILLAIFHLYFHCKYSEYFGIGSKKTLAMFWSLTHSLIHHSHLFGLCVFIFMCLAFLSSLSPLRFLPISKVV